MKALIKERGKDGIILKKVKMQNLENDSVKIKVCSVGLCRTDLFVANGIIPIDFDLVLGHEFAGVVVESKSQLFHVGDNVAVNPYFENKGFIGLDLNGCLQEMVCIPESQVIKNNFLSHKIAAYLEPVAASMAVLKACKNKKEKGAVWGKNRIAELTYIILKEKGYNIELLDNDRQVEDNSYDYIIETMFDEKTLKLIIKALKKEGLLVIKSRKKQLTGIIASDLVSKELMLHCVNYYPFKDSMSWLEKNYELVEHLLGNSYHIDDWQIAFNIASEAESKKIFINF